MTPAAGARHNQRATALRHRSRGLLATAALAIALGGCTSPRNVLGTNSSSCFRALVMARAAVGDHGVFTGVRALSDREVRADLSHEHVAVTLPPSVVAATGTLCVIGYRGTYRRADLIDPWPPAAATGLFATVFVEERADRVILTYLSVHPPLRFSRLFH